MISPRDRAHERTRIHRRIRKKIDGTPDRPRLCVFRSLKHIYAQVIDDRHGTTVVSASTADAALRSAAGAGGNVAAAKLEGKAIAALARPKGNQILVFARGAH